MASTRMSQRPWMPRSRLSKSWVPGSSLSICQTRPAVAAAALVVLAVEATSLHAPWLRTRAEDYTPQVRNRLENGLGYSAIEYLEALRWRGLALAAHLAAIGDVDILLAPASRSAAPKIAETDVGGGSNAEELVVAVMRFMRPVNYLGSACSDSPGGVVRQRSADWAAIDWSALR